MAPCDQSSIDRLVSSSPLATAVPDSAFCALKSTSCLLFVLGFVWCQIVSPVTSPNLSKPGTGNSTRDPQHLALSPSVGRISLAFLSSNFRVLCSLLASSLKRSGLRFRELEPSSPRPSNPTTLQDNSHCRRPQVPGTLFWRDGTLLGNLLLQHRNWTTRPSCWVSHQSVCGSASKHDWGAREGHYLVQTAQRGSSRESNAYKKFRWSRMI